jgi:hypothetical protein
MPYTATWIAVKPVPLSGFPFESRLGAATLNVLNQDHHYCDDQKDRDKPAHRIRGDETKKSEDDQYDCNVSSMASFTLEALWARKLH